MNTQNINVNELKDKIQKEEQVNLVTWDRIIIKKSVWNLYETKQGEHIRKWMNWTELKKPEEKSKVEK